MRFPTTSVTVFLTLLLAANAIDFGNLDASAKSGEGFFSRHPRWRRVVKGAGLGIVTGGIGGVVLGGSAMSGAVAGAGRGAAISGAKEQLKKKKTDRR
jgi:hypothetical protein